MADLIGALSLDAYDGRIEPFDPLVHLVRPHNGQIKTAERILSFLEDSELMKQPKNMFKIRIRFDVCRKYMGRLKIP